MNIDDQTDNEVRPYPVGTGGGILADVGCENSSV